MTSLPPDLPTEKGSLILLKIGSDKIQSKEISLILEHSQLFCKIIKKIRFQVWKLGNFWIFFFKIPLLQRPFFSKKKCLRSCSKLAQIKVRVNKFRLFWKICNFFAKSLKKSDFKFEIWPNFKLGIGFF